MSASLQEEGEHEEALSVRAEAVAWWGRLNRLRPGDFTAQYKAAQSDLARRLADAGRPPGAVYLSKQEAAQYLPVNDDTPSRASD